MAPGQHLKPANTMTNREENIIFHPEDNSGAAVENMASYEGTVKAGFPSPAENIRKNRLDLNSYLIKHPSSTFFLKVDGTSMVDDNFDEGDIIVVDKSLEPTNGATAVCCIDGEFTLKKISIEKGCVRLIPANPKFKPITVTEENRFDIWGIVTWIIKKVRQ